MNDYRFPVAIGLLLLVVIAIRYFPWLRTFKLFVRFVRWLHNPIPLFISCVIGLIMLFGGVIGYDLGYGHGSEWVYRLIIVLGAVILLIINLGSLPRRVE